MTGVLSAFVPCASEEEARKIARILVEENLAACVNILPPMSSIYLWEGKIEEATECALMVKTTAEKFDVLQARVKAAHSYDCPCIVASPIVAGNTDYLAWVKKAVS